MKRVLAKPHYKLQRMTEFISGKPCLGCAFATDGVAKGRCTMTTYAVCRPKHKDAGMYVIRQAERGAASTS